MKTRVLTSAFMLLTAPAAFATSPPPSELFYPTDYGSSVSPNVEVIVSSTFGGVLSGAGATLRDEQQQEVPIDVTEGVDAYGSLRVKPRAPLARGRYSLRAGGGSTSLMVDREVDTEPPSAITELNVVMDAVSKEEFITLPPLSDNQAVGEQIAYSVYTAQVPELPDTEGRPALVVAIGSGLSSGRTQLVLFRGDGCIAAFPQGTTGRFNVSVRARDAAGNLGPASPVVELGAAKVPDCNREEAGGGCSALPAPALLPALGAVAFWLSRRRRAHV